MITASPFLQGVRTGAGLNGFHTVVSLRGSSLTALIGGVQPPDPRALIPRTLCESKVPRNTKSFTGQMPSLTFSRVWGLILNNDTEAIILGKARWLDQPEPLS